MKLAEQEAKPAGFTGKIIGHLMNKIHTPFYINFFKNKNIADYSHILDLGCGGGSFLAYLAQRNKSYALYGLDHSAEMIGLASQMNQKALKQKRLTLKIASVSSLDFSDNSFHLITALETVQFWPDLQQTFNEVFRLLKNQGEFIIINRFPATETKYWHLAQLKTSKDYQNFLKAAGFEEIIIAPHLQKGWIVVKAKKL